MTLKELVVLHHEIPVHPGTFCGKIQEHMDVLEKYVRAYAKFVKTSKTMEPDYMSVPNSDGTYDIYDMNRTFMEVIFESEDDIEI